MTSHVPTPIAEEQKTGARASEKLTMFTSTGQGASRYRPDCSGRRVVRSFDGSEPPPRGA
jgi:hypothetical protein